MTHVPSNRINIQDNEFSQKTDGSSNFDWREFACGWGAALINITVTFPINKIIFRQVRQTFKTKYIVEFYFVVRLIRFKIP